MKNRVRAIMVIGAFLLIIVSPHSGASVPSSLEFRAGAASVDITPDVKSRPVPFNGYGARKKAPAQGVHDPLYAKALVLESRDGATGAVSRAAIVTTDLCMVNPAMRKAVLDQIADLGYNDSNLMLTASHTHSGPAALDPRWITGMIMGKLDPQLFDETNRRIASVIREAHEKLAPAKLGVGLGEFRDLVRNRRVKGYSYETRRFSKDAEMKPVDPTMSVVRVESVNGSPIAALVVFGSHPTILGPDNMLISADWPGVFQVELKKAIGGDVVTMFANGAEGDQAPPSIENADDFAWMDWYGTQVSTAAYSLWNNAKGLGPVQVAAAVDTEKLPRMHIRSFLRMPVPRFLTRSVANKAKCGAIRLGDSALIGLPGEAIHTVVMSVREKARALVAQPIVINLANDWIGYITDPQAYKEGGYEAGATLFGKKESAVIESCALNALEKANQVH